jgi:hypothetical protein
MSQFKKMYDLNDIVSYYLKRKQKKAYFNFDNYIRNDRLIERNDIFLSIIIRISKPTTKNKRLSKYMK